MAVSMASRVEHVGGVGIVVGEVGSDVTEDCRGEPDYDNEQDGSDRDAEDRTAGEGHCGIF